MAERRRSRARTLEARENELTAAAYDLAEEQIRSGTASSQVVTHFLKMGSTRELVEQERLRGQIEVDRVKAQQLESQKRIEELYADAIEAMGVYSGHSTPELDQGTKVVLADFEVNVEFEVPRSVRVIVYDSLKGLRIATTRYDHIGTRRSRRRRGQFKDTLGICHRFEATGSDGSHRPQCAIVRLAHPNLGVGIISHELTHAAVWMHELNGNTDPITTKNDEPFVWLVGELVRQTINAMNERGVYEKLDGVVDPSVGDS